jgi:UDP-galactopyranose mutase
MNTFYQLWGTKTPEEAKAKINSQIQEFGTDNPSNLEEQAISLVGKDIYETLIKEYTEKQWGKKATDLPSFIIKRLPVRFTFDNNYFKDKYQGIPIGGYNVLIDKLLEGIEVRTNVDYFSDKDAFDQLAAKVVFTGKIDEYFNYCFEPLEYRSLEFDTQRLEIDNYQGNAVVNYNDKEFPYTRIIEHKHFEFGNQAHTVITKEYPKDWDLSKEAYYPINDEVNQAKYELYKEKALSIPNVIFGGRLAEYRYYDMHQIIASALKRIKTEFHES